MPNRQIRADVFPATFTTVDSEGAQTVHDRVRVIVTLDHVYVFADSQPKPEIVFEDRLTTYTPPIPATRVRDASQLLDRRARLTTEEGHAADFIRTGGCGCGSRMKTMPAENLLPGNSGPAQAASNNDSIS